MFHFASHTQAHSSGVRLLICCCEGTHRIMLLTLPERRERCLRSCKSLHLYRQSCGTAVWPSLAVGMIPFMTVIPEHIPNALQSTLQHCSLPPSAPQPSKSGVITALSRFLSLSPKEDKQFIFSSVAVPSFLAWHITPSHLACCKGGQRLALISNSAQLCPCRIKAALSTPGCLLNSS